jgi:hypothetical protein
MTVEAYITKHIKFTRQQILPWKLQCKENQQRGALLALRGKRKYNINYSEITTDKNQPFN